MIRLSAESAKRLSLLSKKYDSKGRVYYKDKEKSTSSVKAKKEAFKKGDKKETMPLRKKGNVLYFVAEDIN